MKRIKIIFIIFIMLILSLTSILFACSKNNQQINSYNSFKDLSYSLNNTYDKISNIDYENYNLDPSLNYDINDLTINVSDLKISDSTSPIENKKLIENAIHSNNDKLTIIFDINVKTLPIKLRSNINIIINKDIIVSSINYDESILYNVNFSVNEGCALFWAKDAKNISIFGPGSLFGNGESYTNNPINSSILKPLENFNIKERVLEARDRLREAKTQNRPNIINFNNCENILIDHVRIAEAGNWSMVFVDSNDITISHTVIDNNIHVANADGIDVVGSQNVTIKNCFIATADDGICIKSHSFENAENIEIYNCIIISMANNFKIGTETYNNITNVIVKHCCFYMPENIIGGYSGIAIESVDGAKVKDIEITDIYMYGISAPLLIWLGYRHNKGDGELENINIKDIYSINCEISSAITGYKSTNNIGYVKNVSIENFTALYRDGKENLDIGPATYENNMAGYPEITRVLHQYIINHKNSVYYDLPTYGLFARHVDGLKIKNFKVVSRTNTKQIRDNIYNKSNRYDILNLNLK